MYSDLKNALKRKKLYKSDWKIILLKYLKKKNIFLEYL